MLNLVCILISVLLLNVVFLFGIVFFLFICGFGFFLFVLGLVFIFIFKYIIILILIYFLNLKYYKGGKIENCLIVVFLFILNVNIKEL